jgi:hypothetical protein
LFSVSTFLPPLAPRALPRFLATTEALSPPGHSSSDLLQAMNAVPFPVRDPCFISLQLQTILSPTTPCIPILLLTGLSSDRSRKFRAPFPGRFPFLASPHSRRLANASGRIEFIIFLIMDWSFASGCSPPRLSATQLPSATDRPVFLSDRDSHPTVGAYSQAHGYCHFVAAIHAKPTLT